MCKGHVGDKNYRKLQRSVSRIKKNLDVESVLDDLISAEVLSIEDGMDIRHEKKPHAMADVLIQKLIYVGEHGYSIFENVLREHRYGYLVEDIGKYLYLTSGTPRHLKKKQHSLHFYINTF